MNKVLLILLMLFLFSYLYSRGNTDPTKKKKGEVVLFSAVKGTLTLKGLPLEGVKIIRTYPKVGKVDEISETVYTDELGNFSFEEATGNLGIMRILPHEAVISQTIKAEYSDQEHLMWYTCKRNYEPLGELRYWHNDPILSPEMAEAYKEGYILLKGDLAQNEELVQRVNDYILGFISIIDFQFPYELAQKNFEKELTRRKDEFTDEMVKWFDENPDFIDSKIEQESWNEMELEHIIPYRGVLIESIESVEFSDNIQLHYFEEDYGKNSQRIRLHGEIILNVINPKGESLSARIWMSDALFNVREQTISSDFQEHFFGINAFTIDPEADED
jgi:hypothetical protein